MADKIHPTLTDGAVNLEPSGTLIDFISARTAADLVQFAIDLHGVDGARRVVPRELAKKALLRLFDVTVRRSRDVSEVLRVAAPDAPAARRAAVDCYREAEGLAPSVQLMAVACEEVASDG